MGVKRNQFFKQHEYHIYVAQPRPALVAPHRRWHEQVLLPVRKWIGLGSVPHRVKHSNHHTHSDRCHLLQQRRWEWYPVAGVRISLVNRKQCTSRDKHDWACERRRRRWINRTSYAIH